MNSAIGSFARAAHLKAAGTIASALVTALVATMLLAGATAGRKNSGQRGVHAGDRSNPGQVGLGEDQAAAGLDAETSPESIAVQMLAPTIVAPPPEKSPTFTASLPNEQIAAHSADSPPAPHPREINIEPERAPAGAVEPQPDNAALTATPDAPRKTNAEPAISVKCSYDFATVERSLKSGCGELVALGRRTGAPVTLVIVEKAASGAYRLRKTAPSDRLANLGLRLSSADGDLPGIERLIRSETGIEGIIFYFAPSADFARHIISTQQSAIEAFRRAQKSAIGSESIVLTARLGYARDGTPSYEVTSISASSPVSDGSVRVSD